MARERHLLACHYLSCNTVCSTVLKNDDPPVSFDKDLSLQGSLCMLRESYSMSE